MSVPAAQVAARAIRNAYNSSWETRSEEIQPFPLQVMHSLEQGVFDYEGRRSDADPERTFMPAGQGLGMIDDIRPAADIMSDLVRDAMATISRLAPLSETG